MKSVMLGEREVPLPRFSEGILIPLRNRAGEVIAHATVDFEDWAVLGGQRWCLSEGYAYSRLGLMHRLIAGVDPGDKRKVDHISRDRLDNRRSNLRITDDVGNGQNTPPRAGTSAHRGVHWHTARRRWVARAQVNGRTHHLGYFTSEDEAAAAAAAFRAQHMPFSDEGTAALREA